MALDAKMEPKCNSNRVTELYDTNGSNGDNGFHANGHHERLNGGRGKGYIPAADTSEPKTPLQMPIAICGMGMRLPGGIRNDMDLYRFLVTKQDARTTVPATRFDAGAYYNKYNKSGSIATKQGYFLEDIDLTKFDTSMFSMTAAEICHLDPSQRLLLEVVRETFESAGEGNFRGSSIGTYASVYSEDWQTLRAMDTSDHSPYELTGKLDFMLANRMAYEYDLKGPSVTLKAACASSGMALHQALQAIRVGEISAAIVAGTNLMLTPSLSITMSMTGLLSPDGSSKSFDASANGYARAEAVSCVYIKRLDEAIKDGNPIRAVIRASGSNADGRTQGGLTIPNPVAHEALIRQVYQDAGLDFGETAMVECHGTGTAAGDPLEVSAVANCFGEHGVYIGSIKPNLGHAEAVAGINSVLKAVVSLENETIIPNIKFVNPNPAIPWERAKLRVPTEPQPWPKDRCERMSVNSIGVGGSNFILESARSFRIASPTRLQHLGQPQLTRKTKHLLLFSANSTEALQVVGDQYLKYLEKSPDEIASLAYTLAYRRERLNLSSFCVTDGSSPFQIINPAKNSRQKSGQTAFVFTGQGAQWVHMGRELMLEYPAFRESILTMDDMLQSIEHAPGWKIGDILLECSDQSVIANPEVSQPICTALQIALVDLLATWRVTPEVVMGHSSGEIAAAYAAGALCMRAAIIVAFYRGFVCGHGKLQSCGAMAAVGMGIEDVRPYLCPGVCIACENSNKSVTLSGEVQLLEESLAAIKHHYPDAFIRKLQVSVAYHSKQMQAVSSDYYGLISSHIDPQVPRIPFISSVSSKRLTDAADFGPKYWQENLERPVKFHAAARNLLEEFPDASIHLEIGPHAALAGPLRQIYAEQRTSTQYWPCLTRGKDDADAFLTTMGQLQCAGVGIRLPISANARVLTRLPTFPWQYDKSYWAETRAMANWRFPQHGFHDLLGRRTLESPDTEPTWRNNLRLVNVPWLQDHAVHNNVVFPAAGYISMAGEAVSQLLKKGDRSPGLGYTVRDVHLSNAMLLQDGIDTEIITTLRPKWLTAKLDSKWYEFTITSHNEVGWTRHCRGLVTDGRAVAARESAVNTFSRKISTDRWYKTMAQVGLKYGPRFQGLQEITASATDKVASFTVTDKQEDWESSYAMHPATLDVIFQSWSVAKTNGVYRQFTGLSMPTYIEELYVGCAALNTIRLETSGEQRASSYGIVDGAVVLSLRGFEATQLESGDTTDFEVQHLQWMPDFDFADPAKLMNSKYSAVTQLALTERLYVLCAVGIQKRLAGVTPSQPHFAYFLTWLDNQIEKFREPNYPLVEDSAKLLELDAESREELIGDCLDRLQCLDVSPLGMAVWKTYMHLPDVIAGCTNFLDLLLDDGLLQRIYDWMNDLQDVSDLFRTLGNSRPQLKILEIGAGTGGLTSKVLSSLRSEYGERLYLSYTFTDISPGFFVKAQTRFEGYDSIEYKVLDISQDPVQQGFKEGEFDLIVASNVLHATPSLSQTLQNCRKLLRRDGHLFMQELSPTTKSANFVMGLFSGWWLGRDDGRLDEPYVSPKVWDAKLRDAGFDGISAILLGEEDSQHFNANILAKPTTEPVPRERVALLVGPEGLGPIAQETQKVLELEGYEVDVCIWSENMPPPDQSIVSFIDVENNTMPVLRNIHEQDLGRLLELMDNLGQANLLWLTKPAQINCSDPHNAQILGLARTARLELGLHFATMELDDAVYGVSSAIFGVLQKLQRAAHADNDNVEDMEEDMEYAWRAGLVHISRFHWLRVDEALADTSANAVPEARRLVVGEVGMLHSLEWRPQHFEDLAAEHVRVRTSTIGMNFKEILHALGVLRVDTIDGRIGGINATGFEGAGRIIAVGSGVRDVQVGDRVMWVNTGLPGFATEAQIPSAWCVKIPNHLSDEDAATMPVVYYTVLTCLLDKANLQRGQSLLIHSAAGGVGIAALHVARWLGADVYVTVGSDEKVKYLMSEFGIPQERIFHSRDDSFAHDIMRATNMVGVDAILNSLSGELLHASWKCLAPEGCMVEIGQRDVVGHGQLAMSPFSANRTFTCVDASKLLCNLPKSQRKLQQIVELFENGHIHPIRPTTVFNAVDVVDAFRRMQLGQHLGKLVVKFPEKEDILPLTRTAPKLPFRADASYLLVGGTGGLGKTVASWMNSCGATSFIFLSRSAGQSTVDKEFFDELRAAGCEVQCYAGDVADVHLLHTIVQQALQPISGVIQMAMVLRDVALMDMDEASWSAAVQPKINGTWNLHHTLPTDLDFFVLFSSMAGLFGHFGQANYASANAFLDAFVQYRQTRGLAASVLDLGPVEDVGYVANMTKTHRSIATYVDTVSEQDFLDALHLAMVPPRNRSCNQYTYENPSQLALVPRCALSLADPRNNAIWARERRMAIYRNIENTSVTSLGTDASDTVRSFIASLVAEPGKLEDVEAPKMLARAVGARVATFLMMNDVEHLDMSRTLAAMGVDSLVSIELRNWWKQAFGVDVSVLELMNGGSIEQLGELAVDRLKKKYGAKSVMNAD